MCKVFFGCKHHTRQSKWAPLTAEPVISHIHGLLIIYVVEWASFFQTDGGVKMGLQLFTFFWKHAHYIMSFIVRWWGVYTHILLILVMALHIFLHAWNWLWPYRMVLHNVLRGTESNNSIEWTSLLMCTFRACRSLMRMNQKSKYWLHLKRPIHYYFYLCQEQCLCVCRELKTMHTQMHLV